MSASQTKPHHSHAEEETLLLETSGKLLYSHVRSETSRRGRQRPSVKLQTPYLPCRICPTAPQPPPHPASEAVLHQIEGIGAITPAYLKPPKCVEQVAHNALLLLFGSRSQDGRFHNAFKWHITGRSLTGLPTTILPAAKEEQQAAARTFNTEEEERGGRDSSPFNHRTRNRKGTNRLPVALWFLF